MSSQDSRDNSSVGSGAVNRRDILLASTSLVAASALGSTALAQITRAQAQTAQAGAETSITEQEAHAIGVDAYLYFYPLISFDVTRLYSTDIEPGSSYDPPFCPGCFIHFNGGLIDRITYHLVAFNYMNGNFAAAATAAPLPAVLPLVATGFGALALFGWRRKRNPQAVVGAGSLFAGPNQRTEFRNV